MRTIFKHNEFNSRRVIKDSGIVLLFIGLFLIFNFLFKLSSFADYKADYLNGEMVVESINFGTAEISFSSEDILKSFFSIRDVHMTLKTIHYHGEEKIRFDILEYDFFIHDSPLFFMPASR